MADQARVEVHGLDELVAGSRKLFDRIGAEAPRRFSQVADRAASATQARVPRRSGALASTLAADETRGGATVGYDGGVPYDGWIEFGGTRGRPYMAGGRYLFPTAMAAEPLLAAAANDVARDEIRRMRWPRPT